MRPIDLVLAIALPLSALHAQEAVPDSGDRVRIHITDAGTSQTVTGTVVFQDADSVTLLTQDVRGRRVIGSLRGGLPDVRVVVEQHFTVLRPQIARMEMSTGRHSNAGTGALLGGGIGLLGGAILGVESMCGNSGGFFCLNTTGVALVAATTGALGAAIGAIVGMGTHHENWITSLP